MLNGMHPTVSVVTLISLDLGAAKSFYAGLGFTLVYDKRDLLFLDAGSLHLAICKPEVLMDDLGKKDAAQPHFFQVPGHAVPRQVLSLNVDSADQVVSILQHIDRLGGKIVKSASQAPWGGTRGYFADPDQHIWEVVYNPLWQKDSGGKLKIP